MQTTNITPVAVKFEIHAYDEVYDVSNSLDNWKDAELMLKRDGTSGVFHQFTTPFEFVYEAYDIVKNLFDTHQYRAVADMYVYIRRDDWMDNAQKYHNPQIFNLDFSTYDESDTKIEIATKRTSLYDYLKSKGKVVYDIPVSEIKETRSLWYDRIEMENKIALACVTNRDRYQLDSGSGFKSIGITYEKAEIAVQDVIYAQTVPEYESFDVDNSKFIFASSFIESVLVDFDIDIAGSIGIENIGDTRITALSLVLFKVIAGGSIGSRTTIATYVFNVSSTTINVNRRIRGTTSLDKDEGLYFMLSHEVSGSGFFAGIFPSLEGTINLRYNAIYDPVDIDVINPKNLLQRLVNEASETSGVYSSDIEDVEFQDKIMLAAAESVRGIEPRFDDGVMVSKGAEIHTSYNAFAEWMKVYGYEPHIDATSVVFKKRSKAFRSDILALELQESDCADLRRYVNDDYIYSGVKVGYERKDIENANVRFEFNGQHDYSTESNLQNKVLELISPYRADCYGIEFLAQERLRQTTDNKADKDIFVIDVMLGMVNFALRYVVFRNLFSGNVLRSIATGQVNYSLFNGNLNPRNLLLRNLDLIGVSANDLRFTASDSNAEIIIDGQPINANHSIPNGVGLFDAITYDIASKNILNLPTGDSINGVVKFHYKGKVYEGFIDEISKNPAWESETTWKLRKKKG